MARQGHALAARKKKNRAPARHAKTDVKVNKGAARISSRHRHRVVDVCSRFAEVWLVSVKSSDSLATQAALLAAITERASKALTKYTESCSASLKMCISAAQAGFYAHRTAARAGTGQAFQPPLLLLSPTRRVNTARQSEHHSRRYFYQASHTRLSHSTYNDRWVYLTLPRLVLS